MENLEERLYAENLDAGGGCRTQAGKKEVWRLVFDDVSLWAGRGDTNRSAEGGVKKRMGIEKSAALRKEGNCRTRARLRICRTCCGKGGLAQKGE